MWEVSAKGVRINDLQLLSGCPCICSTGYWAVADNIGLAVGGCGCACAYGEANKNANAEKADLMD